MLAYQFTGRDSDAAGLSHYRARYYDPEVGRFISEDAIGFDAGDVNVYGYVRSNPIRLTDPTGDGHPGLQSTCSGDAWE